MSKRHEDYLIGIVCSLQIEYVAMIAFLDEEHAPLQLDERDQNVYTPGSLYGHNVVIACMPSGMYGAVSAAVTARDMIWSFSAIRFCLLVGIGGGIPSEVNDIRLGDVVVGIPSGTYGGVVQIDLGKRRSDNTFQRTGRLNSPPQTLLHAVQVLKSRGEISGLDLNQDISQVLERYPQIRERYEAPGRHRDCFSGQTIHTFNLGKAALHVIIPTS